MFLSLREGAALLRQIYPDLDDVIGCNACDYSDMSKPAIRYAFDNKPDTGAAQCVADGIHWLRMPLPFSIDHINLWLLEDGDGWVVVDTGIGGKVTKAAWEKTFSGIMNDKPIHHVIVTHMHPDHAGCAGHSPE